MSQEQRQLVARDEAWVPKADRIKISTTNMRIDPTMPQKEETYQVILDIIKNTTCYNAFLITADVLEIFKQQFYTKMDINYASGEKLRRLSAEEAWETIEDCAQCDKQWKNLTSTISNQTIAILKAQLVENEVVCVMIPKCMAWLDDEPIGYDLMKESYVSSRLKFVRTGEDFQEYGRAIPDTMLTEKIKQPEAYPTFLALSTGLIPPRKTRGKGSKGKKAPVTLKKKSLISADDNIIPEPDVALELGKSISQTKAEIAEEERRLHETHERLVTAKPTGVEESDESDGEPANRLTGKRRPSERLAADTKKTIKASKEAFRLQQITGDSSEGAGITPEVPDELTGKTLREGVGIIPKVPDEVKDGDEEDDERSIDIEETGDERTDSKNGDQAMADADRNVVEKVEEEKGDEEEKQVDDDQAQEDQVDGDVLGTLVTMSQKEKPEVPRSSSSQSLSSNYSPLLDVLVLVIPQQTTITTTPTPITTPLPTTPITTPPVTPPLPATETPDAPIPLSEAFNAVLQRVSTLEKDVKELKQVDHSAVIVKSIRSQVPTAINEYLGSSLRDSLQKSYERHPAHKELYDALIQSLFMDEDDMDKADATVDLSTQVKRKYDDQDEDPTARSDRVKEKKRPRKDTQPSKKSSTSSKGTTPSKTSKSGKSVSIEEPDEEHVHEVTMDAEENIAGEMGNAKEQPDSEVAPKTDNAPRNN
ncbi:hypothetical protein Tco_1427448 [Tanacetum coccineum]